MEVCTLTFFNFIRLGERGEKQTGDETESWFLKESNRTFLSALLGFILASAFYPSISQISLNKEHRPEYYFSPSKGIPPIPLASTRETEMIFLKIMWLLLSLPVSKTGS